MSDRLPNPDALDVSDGGFPGMPGAGPASAHSDRIDSVEETVRDIAEVPAIEIIMGAAVHLMTAAAVKVGLAEDEESAHHTDLDEARKLITALAGLITAAAPEVGNVHARSLKDGLKSLQLAFREASIFPDPPGEGPGEKYTGYVAGRAV